MVAAGWSNEATEVLIIVLGEQKIQNQLDGVARNNKSCVRESFSHSKNAAMNEFSSKQCLRNCCFLLKNSFLLFSALFFAIYFLCSLATLCL